MKERTEEVIDGALKNLSTKIKIVFRSEHQEYIDLCVAALVWMDKCAKIIRLEQNDYDQMYSIMKFEKAQSGQDYIVTFSLTDLFEQRRGTELLVALISPHIKSIEVIA